MLLANNTERVINLLNMFENLKDVDKIRLTIHLFENLQFSTDFDIDNIIKTLKELLQILDSNYNKVITNFAKYKNLLFISAKYMELSIEEKKKYSIEVLFSIFESDFKSKEINTRINKNIDVYNYSYSLNIL